MAVCVKFSPRWSRGLRITHVKPILTPERLRGLGYVAASAVRTCPERQEVENFNRSGRLLLSSSRQGRVTTESLRDAPFTLLIPVDAIARGDKF